MGVSLSSLAYIAVTMLSAVFEDGYGIDAIAAMGPSGSVIDAIEPTSLETLTIRAAGARRSSGSIALVTATTPNTFVSYTVRIVASVVWLGAPLPSPRAMPALLTRMSSLPNSAAIHSAARATDFSPVTSSWTNRASAPPSRSARSASAPLASSRAPMSTVMPRAPSSRAVSNPMPLLAPVIRAMVVMAPILATTTPQRERPAEPGTGSTTHRAPGNGAAGLAAPRLPLAAFSSVNNLSEVASLLGPCQGLPGSPLADPAPHYR